ncbi:hypothetical protein ACFWR9_29685 [Streptomyces sp. NPDC058534]|uniref:hypothetical protein n=1 Tax=Streptomyces sp. NPDC058534 TaxID=3346541 RepID=UPI00365EA51D
MRKIQKAALVVAMLGSVSALGAGTAMADGGDAKFDVKGGGCYVYGDTNQLIGNVGVLNGVVGGLLTFGNEGDHGTQENETGHKVDCSTKGFTG